jgi:hypothetical protein
MSMNNTPSCEYLDRIRSRLEDDVYAALSNRFGDIFSVLGQLPDAFEDDWIAAILTGLIIAFSNRRSITLNVSDCFDPASVSQ